MPMKFPSFRSRREDYPEKMWTRCPSCEEQLFNKQLEKAMNVCPSCGHHFRLSATMRLSQLLDDGSFVERDPGLVSVDPLGFVDQKPYPDRVAAAQLATGLRDAAVWGTGRIEGMRIAILVMDFGFMGGSMGAVVGEKVARAAEGALEEGIPLVIVSASGGPARPQFRTTSARSNSSSRRPTNETNSLGGAVRAPRRLGQSSELGQAQCPRPARRRGSAGRAVGDTPLRL